MANTKRNKAIKSRKTRIRIIHFKKQQQNILTESNKNFPPIKEKKHKRSRNKLKNKFNYTKFQ